MSSSTRLLFKLIRTRLILGMSVMPVLFFCLVLFKPQISIGYPVFILWVGLVVTSLLDFPAELNQATFFPVTDHQMAWIPMAVWGGITLSGTFGVILGQWVGITTGKISFNETILTYLSSIQVVPFILFLLFLLQRTPVINPVINKGMAFPLIWLTIIIINSHTKIKTTPPEWMFFGHTVWPLWILGSLLLIWEAPQKIASLRRRESLESETNSGKNQDIFNTSDPLHQTWGTGLLDSITWTLFTVVAGTFLFKENLDAFPPHLIVERNIYFVTLGLCILFLLPFLLIKVWNRNRASGMNRSRATWTLLIEMTGIGYGMRDWLGVSRGEISRCRSCRNLRLVWHKVCPHCANRSIPSNPRSQEEKRKTSWLSQLWPLHDPEALTFRVSGLLIVVLMLLLSNWERWFEN